MNQFNYVLNETLFRNRKSAITIETICIKGKWNEIPKGIKWVTALIWRYIKWPRPARNIYELKVNVRYGFFFDLVDFLICAIFFLWHKSTKKLESIWRNQWWAQNSLNEESVSSGEKYSNDDFLEIDWFPELRALWSFRVEMHNESGKFSD